MLCTSKPIGEVMGRKRRDPQRSSRSLRRRAFGAITVRDILAELEKPGRDPRPDFKVARFNDGVRDIRTCSPA